MKIKPCFYQTQDGGAELAFLAEFLIVEDLEDAKNLITEKRFKLTLSGNQFYYTDASILLVKVFLCSKNITSKDLSA